ncbi:hypothetical protein ACFSKW_54440 [Nonomuraea mangrovi]|uniref:DUF2029 domain-containing protein n=1 Tax=Nonomuraea mangrovi TaxID=2316207 RepID=A0ABW4THD6_9ACTN
MTPLERRYRRLMWAYPRAYRSAHGDELLDVLLGHTDPKRSRPPLKEAAGLLVNGLRERVWQATTAPMWADGLHLGVTALCAAHLSGWLPYATSIPVWCALSTLGLILTIMGRFRLALPLVLLTGIKSWTLGTGVVFVDATLLPIEPAFLMHDALYGNSGPIGAAAWSLPACAGLAILAVRGERPRRRSLWWPAVVPLLAVADPAWMALDDPSPLVLVRVVAEAATLAGAVWAGRMTGDRRWALAAALYLVAGSTAFGEHLVDQSRQNLAYWGLLAFLTLVAAVAPRGSRTRAFD